MCPKGRHMSHDPDLVAQSNTSLWSWPMVKREAHAPRQANQNLSITCEIIPLGKEGSFFSLALEAVIKIQTVSDFHTSGHYLVWIGFLSLTPTRILPNAEISTWKQGVGTGRHYSVDLVENRWDTGRWAWPFITCSGSSKEAAGQIFPICVLELNPGHFHESAEATVTKLK